MSFSGDFVISLARCKRFSLKDIMGLTQESYGEASIAQAQVYSTSHTQSFTENLLHLAREITKSPEELILEFWNAFPDLPH